MQRDIAIFFEQWQVILRTTLCMCTKCNTKMNKLTEIYTIRFSVQQAKSLEKLKEYDVNISRFIRQAIKEKISRDFCILNIIYYICIAVQL